MKKRSNERVSVPLTKEQEEEVESWADFYSRRERDRKKNEAAARLFVDYLNQKRW